MRKGISFTLILLLCLCLLFALTSRSSNDNEPYDTLSRKMGISLPKEVAIEYTDSHGGFHGDGDLFAVVTASNEQAKAQMNTILSHVGWCSILPDEMYAAFFGGVVTIDGTKGTTGGYLHDLEFDIPNVKNGYFYYKDRFFEQNGKQCPYAPYTQNFTLAIFDSDTSTLYFLEGDT